MMKSAYDWVPIPLSTTEVERITQVDRKTLIRWRNRGLLAKSGPRTELYTPQQAVEILALQEMRAILPAFPLEQFVGHATTIAPNVLWHALHISKPWQFVGTPVQKLTFEDAMRAEDNELLELCREILKIPQDKELHTFSAWDGAEWKSVSSVDTNSKRRPPCLLIDIFWLGETFVSRLEGPLYEVRLKSSQRRRNN
jgi:hypothetical protein